MLNNYLCTFLHSKIHLHTYVRYVTFVVNHIETLQMRAHVSLDSLIIYDNPVAVSPIIMERNGQVSIYHFL